ncbi:MAG: prepilin-type N-terminal cleavage/methylation domain-containing protein [Candidatus Gastranaerophilales bacterium]|nr:prepilin-type N-terminal cleavage/methylation domain-containing protein [Candidatus Gastranaerophilales bacterium]
MKRFVRLLCRYTSRNDSACYYNSISQNCLMYKINKGFTLAEMLIVLMLMGVIITLSIPVIKKVSQGYNRVYASVFNFTQAVLMDIPTPLDSTFCNNFANKVNTIGAINCITSDVATDQPNFITSNGVRWFGMEGGFTTNPKTVTVDIQGNKGPNEDDVDLLKIRVFSDGHALPELDTVEAGYAYSGASSCKNAQIIRNTYMSGMYTFNFSGTPADVFCDMSTNTKDDTPSDQGGWTIADPSVNLSSIITDRSEVIVYFKKGTMIRYLLLNQLAAYSATNIVFDYTTVPGSIKVSFATGSTNGFIANEASKSYSGTSSSNYFKFKDTTTGNNTQSGINIDNIIGQQGISVNPGIPDTYFKQFGVYFAGGGCSVASDANHLTNADSAVLGIR